MNTISRRHFLKLTGAAAALAATPIYLKAQSLSGRVVVVGGGFAGATLAKYLKPVSYTHLDVYKRQAEARMAYS